MIKAFCDTLNKYRAFDLQLQNAETSSVIMEREA